MDHRFSFLFLFLFFSSFSLALKHRNLAQRVEYSKYFLSCFAMRIRNIGQVPRFHALMQCDVKFARNVTSQAVSCADLPNWVRVVLCDGYALSKSWEAQASCTVVSTVVPPYFQPVFGHRACGRIFVPDLSLGVGLRPKAGTGARAEVLTYSTYVDRLGGDCQTAFIPPGF